MAAVPAVVRQRPGRQVGRGPQRKRQRGPVPTHNGEAGPFHYFAKEIGAGNVLKQPALRYFVARFIGFAQVDEPVIRPQIDAGAEGKNGYADDKPGICEPGSIVIRAHCAQPGAVEVAVDDIKKHGRNGNRHWDLFAPGVNSHGKNNTSVEVMRHPQGKKQPGCGRFYPISRKEKITESQRRDDFHDNPTEAVVDHGPPSAAGVSAVGCGKSQLYGH